MKHKTYDSLRFMQKTVIFNISRKDKHQDDLLFFYIETEINFLYSITFFTRSEISVNMNFCRVRYAKSYIVKDDVRKDEIVACSMKATKIIAQK